jgi:Tol biopolymer transport system component
MLRRMMFFALLLSVLSACDSELPNPIGQISFTYFNCLNLGNQVQVQLNTHLEPVPEVAHSTSPDGNYQIVSVARSLDERFLYLKDTNTGKRTLLDDAVHKVTHIVWAPNSRVVSYEWEDAQGAWYRGIADAETAEIFLDKQGFRGTYLAAFSFDGEYLTMRHFNPVVQYQVTVHPSRHYSYDEDLATLEGAISFAWSPIDHLLAYSTFTGLGLLDLDSGIMHQEPHATGDPFVQSRDFGSLVWSPDGRYLTVSYESSPYDHKIGVYSTENQSMRLLTTFAAAAGPDYSSYLYLNFLATDGRYIIYFTKQNSEDQYYDLWRFDIDTLQHELLADHLISHYLSGETSVSVRDTSEEMLLEIRDRAGHPVRSYVLPSRWSWSCRRLDAPFDDVIDCKEEDDFILLDEALTPIWRTDAQNDESPKLLGSWTSDDNRFVARSFSQGERAWLEFIDLITRQIYRLPDQFNNIVAPLGISDLDDFDVYAAPDEQSWLVLVGQALFRLYPADNTWELLGIDSRIDHIVWSPDGQRYAIVTKDDPDTWADDVFVHEADELKQWSLGGFPTSMLQDVTWMHCGDSFAPLRDYIAAQPLE